MIGRRFGRWHVLRRAGSGRGREARWECVCDCGTERAGARQVMLGELIDSVSGIARAEQGDKAKDIFGRVYEDFLFTLCAEWNG
jgi:hypothetical protein